VAEPDASDAEQVAELREDLQKGLDDIAAGRVIDGKDVFALLKSRFQLNSAATQTRRPGESRDPPLRGTSG
jgi:hypothetical protein